MIIKSIKLTNFRNHDHYELECNQKTSLILGENGCGKTSILEAIYILTRGKSFRATDPEIIKRDTDFYRIELEYLNGETVVATYDGLTKNFSAQGRDTSCLPKKSKYPVILFLPSDLNLISHAPGRRRDYFDLIFSELSNEYATNFSKYKKTLRQRNEILKNENLTREMLFSWDRLLARLGIKLNQMRRNYINEINSRLNETYHSIAENNDEINIKYRSEVPEDITEAAYLAEFNKNFIKESCIGHTIFGTHHDDYIFEFNHKPADGSASRGETRSIILALKFIEARLIEETLNQKPLILLDDVFSELDEARRQCLVQNFKQHQVILTSVGLRNNSLPEKQ